MKKRSKTPLRGLTRGKAYELRGGFCRYLKLRERLVNVKGSLIDEQALGRVSGAAKEMILKRTSDGVSIEGSASEPYSSDYRKVRERKGRPSDSVDLRLTGKMLDDLAVEVNAEENEPQIFFINEENTVKAGCHQVFGAGRNKARRKFFGLSEEEKNGLTELYSSHIERVLKENL